MAASFLSVVHDSVQAMEVDNPHMKTIKTDHSVIIDVGKYGAYYVESVEGMIVLTSPVSGVIKYEFDAAGRRWLGV
eukprot:CAMPEP_0182462510 /NCGR_PEP_ID=MMETSP1319-20130603/6752_1 /TAXON_ID=172717 /ORGANISM="Bolidomonas pacifica, Strain RCC208" /LENGTH=75 /DNA_ID=CAMNT_0024661945 /DNA_START=227 /DNA_END=451 /DNA_ORIENTATION=+